MNKLPMYIAPDFGTAIVPIKYIEAIKALKACQTIDDAKQWAGKAEALAAWAKIYKHDEAGKEARRLKLHAYRKMGQLAEALRPTSLKKRKGASSLLKEHGLDQHKRREALQLARATAEEFTMAVTDARGISVTAAQFRGRGRPGGKAPSSDAYGWLYRDQGLRLHSLVGKLRVYKPRDVALGMRADERENAHAIAVEIVDWFDELDRCLPKSTNTVARLQ